MPTTQVILLVPLFSFAAFAQSERGSITGVISDPGAAIPAIPVSIVNRDTKMTSNSLTTSSGEYSELMKLDFHGEGFNVFNRVVFSNPSDNLNSLNFGQITGQRNSPRTMQVALKLHW